MPDTDHPLAEPFDDMPQQREAATLGMWVFLSTEIMFFGGLFTGYTVARWAHSEIFQQASHHMNLLLGSINTGVLLCSSLTMALAVHAAQTGERRSLVRFLTATALLGAVFLGIKGLEYSHHIKDHLLPGHGFHYAGQGARGAELFFWIYFTMTGLHAVHVAIGIGVVGVMAFRSHLGHFPPERYIPVEVTGLYWHFVDIVWVFLFPLFYLAGHR